MEYDLTLFEKGLEELGITLSQDQKKQFITYYEYLVEKNKVMNLTAITEYEEVILTRISLQENLSLTLEPAPDSLEFH